MNISFLKKSLPLIFFISLFSGFSTSTLSAPENIIEPVNSSQIAVEPTVNINRDNAAALATALKGIGLKKAEAIVEWRSRNGDFTDVDQLLEIKGIGEKILLTNKEKIAL